MGQEAEASMILKAALRDMDDLISECISASENSKLMFRTSTDKCIQSGNNEINKSQVSRGLLNKNFDKRHYTEDVTKLVEKLNTCLTELKKGDDENNQFTPNSRKFIMESLKDVLDFLRIYPNVDFNESHGDGLLVSKKYVNNPIHEDAVRSQIITLRNQINLQALRIAELEQMQKQKINSVRRPQSVQWDQLDLMAELSRQQLQISALEQIKQRLEEQLLLQQKQANINISDMDPCPYRLVPNGDSHSFTYGGDSIPSSLGGIGQFHYRPNVYVENYPSAVNQAEFENRINAAPHGMYQQLGEDQSKYIAYAHPNRYPTSQFVYENEGELTPKNPDRYPPKSISLNELTYQSLDVNDSTYLHSVSHHIDGMSSTPVPNNRPQHAITQEATENAQNNAPSVLTEQAISRLPEYTPPDNASRSPQKLVPQRSKTSTGILERMTQQLSSPSRKNKQRLSVPDEITSNNRSGPSFHIKNLFDDNSLVRISVRDRSTSDLKNRGLAGRSCEFAESRLNSMDDHSAGDARIKKQSQTRGCMDLLKRQSMPPCYGQPFSICGTSAKPVLDFSIWDRDMVSAFLHELGLGYAVHFTRRGIRQGSDLVFATDKEIVQSTGIRNPLHLRKLLLHMQARTKEIVRALHITEASPFLTTPPVEFDMTAWLDDVGLMAYEHAFQLAGIDVLLLNNLTVQDLLSLKITNELHYLSLRRGIQILRHIGFDLSRLIRANHREIKLMEEENCSHVNKQRKTLSEFTETSIVPTEQDNQIQTDNSATLSTTSSTLNEPASICLWTQCRLMAWLHGIELPEYAPAIVGSGVHGALLVLEDRFSAELLADILRIPISKTLVRRHLSSKFAELVGEQIWRRKLAVLENPDTPMLTVSSKIKQHRKHTLLTYLWHKHDAIELELVCPMEMDNELASIFQMNSPVINGRHSDREDKHPADVWSSSQSLSTELL